MTTPRLQCDHELLRQSLSDGLSEHQEESLAQHLSQCEACRNELERMAAELTEWSHVVEVLRHEASTRLSSGSADETCDPPGDSAIDFAVTFLEPSNRPGALGRRGVSRHWLARRLRHPARRLRGGVLHADGDCCLARLVSRITPEWIAPHDRSTLGTGTKGMKNVSATASWASGASGVAAATLSGACTASANGSMRRQGLRRRTRLRCHSV